jgi:hypothetical protein
VLCCAAGQYVLLYDGVGRVTTAGDAAVTATAPNRLQLQITPKDGEQLLKKE